MSLLPSLVFRRRFVLRLVNSIGIGASECPSAILLPLLLLRKDVYIGCEFAPVGVVHYCTGPRCKVTILFISIIMCQALVSCGSRMIGLCDINMRGAIISRYFGLRCLTPHLKKLILTVLIIWLEFACC